MINIKGSFFLTTAMLLLGGACATVNGQTGKTKKEKQAERKERIDQMIRQEEEGALVYHSQNLFGGKLNSDGWGVFYEKGIMKTVNKTTLYSFEFGERKDHKEFKDSKGDPSTGFLLGNPYIYGKQNNFYYVKLGYGQSYLLGGKGNRNGVAVSAIYSGGVSVGLLKPYYLDVQMDNGQIEPIRWLGDSSLNDQYFLTQSRIAGSGGLFKGWGELKVKPGLHAKGALRFDYGRYNELVSAVETGFNVEYYFSDMPIMVNNDPRKFFLNVFVALEFGKRK